MASAGWSLNTERADINRRMAPARFAGLGANRLTKPINGQAQTFSAMVHHPLSIQERFGFRRLRYGCLREISRAAARLAARG